MPGRRVRTLARRILGSSPSAPVGLRARGGGLDDYVAHGAVELGLRIGEAMLSLGAPAADVTGAIQRVVGAFGLAGCHVEVTFTAITVSYDRGLGASPLTLMRVVGERVPDYRRLAGVFALADSLRGPIPRTEATARLEETHSTLDEVVSAPRPYGRWVVTVMLSVLAAAVAFLLGGGPPVALAAGLTTALVDRVTWALGRWGLPPFFVQAAGAGLASLVAVGLFLVVPVLPFELAMLPPSLVVASGVVVLLAGLSLVGAAEDAISGFPVTAGARTFEVLVLTLGIVVGIGGVLDVARRLGVPLEIIDVPRNTSPVAVQIAAAAVVALAWAGASYAGLRAAGLAALAGGTAWSVFALMRDLGLGPAVASAAAALVIGLLGESVGRRIGVPSIVTSVCGIIPLLPGLGVYRGLFLVINEQGGGGFVEGAAVLLGAAMVGLGLAGGVTLGEFLAAPRRGGRRRRRPPGRVPRSVPRAR